MSKIYLIEREIDNDGEILMNSFSTAEKAKEFFGEAIKSFCDYFVGDCYNDPIRLEEIINKINSYWESYYINTFEEGYTEIERGLVINVYQVDFDEPFTS